MIKEFKIEVCVEEWAHEECLASDVGGVIKGISGVKWVDVQLVEGNQ